MLQKALNVSDNIWQYQLITCNNLKETKIQKVKKSSDLPLPALS